MQLQAQVNIYIDEVPGTVDTPISVDVKVSNFSGVAGAQFSVNWDSTELSYQGVSNLALDADETSNFNRSATSSGKIGYFLADMTLAGFSLPDDAVLFSIDFNITAPDNTVANLVFSNDPISQVIADSTSAAIEAEYSPGAVLIGNVTSAEEFTQDDPRFVAYPNPFRGQTQLTYTAVGSGTATLIVSDVSGKEILSRQLSLIAGDNRINLEAAELPAAGVYFLRIKTDDGSFGRKIVLQGNP